MTDHVRVCSQKRSSLRGFDHQAAGDDQHAPTLGGDPADLAGAGTASERREKDVNSLCLSLPLATPSAGLEIELALRDTDREMRF